MKDMSWLERRA